MVIIPQGKVAAGKLAGAVAYGAEVIQIEGSFDDALSLVVQISEKHPIALVNSLNPYRLEGQKTAAFEICDVLGSAPDWLCLPVGNAGNITAYWMGFRQYHDAAKQRAAAHPGRAGRRRCAAGAGPPGGTTRDRRHRHPHRAPGARRAGSAKLPRNPTGASWRSATRKS